MAATYGKVSTTLERMRAHITLLVPRALPSRLASCALPLAEDLPLPQPSRLPPPLQAVQWSQEVRQRALAQRRGSGWPFVLPPGWPLPRCLRAHLLFTLRFGQPQTVANQTRDRLLYS